MYKRSSGVKTVRSGGCPARESSRQKPLWDVDSAAKRVPLLLIETNSLILGGITSLLHSSGFEVIASASSFDSIPSSLERQPEIILIGADNIAAIEEALEVCRMRYPSAPRIALHESQGDQLLKILRIGVNACLGRSVSAEALLMTLNLAMQGATVISCPLVPTAGQFLTQGARVKSTAAENNTEGSDLEQGGHRLSTREIAILECLVHGDSNKLIARKFQIAEATVKVHVKAILRKIRAANRTQAAIWAMNHLSLARSETGTPAVSELRH